jgi:hypothetical protein
MRGLTNARHWQAVAGLRVRLKAKRCADERLGRLETVSEPRRLVVKIQYIGRKGRLRAMTDRGLFFTLGGTISPKKTPAANTDLGLIHNYPIPPKWIPKQLTARMPSHESSYGAKMYSN